MLLREKDDVKIKINSIKYFIFASINFFKSIIMPPVFSKKLLYNITKINAKNYYEQTRSSQYNFYMLITFLASFFFC